MMSVLSERKSSMDRRSSPNDFLEGTRPARPNSFTNLGHNLVNLI